MGILGSGYRLSSEQVSDFRRDGYLVLEDVVTEAELQSIEPVVDAFVAGEVPDMGRDSCDMSSPYGRPFEEWNIVNALLPRVYRPELRNNVYERRAASIGKQLLGEGATLDYDQILAKRPGRAGAIFAWHQDLGYWPTNTPDTKTVTCSLALDDATAENGCLQVVPGSQREALLRRHRAVFRADGAGPRDTAHTLSVELDAEDRVVDLPVRRGGVTVHDERIVHGSPGNASDRWRRTYVVAFRSRATVEYERAIGFTHSHNDTIQWTTHLEALASDAD